MSDQPFRSAELADILRAFGLPREVRAESPIPAEVRAALGLLPAEAGSTETLPTATACFELHIGNSFSVPAIAHVPTPPPQAVVPFQVTVDLTTYPYTVLSGTFIFDSPEVTGWEITQGQFGTTGSPATPYVPNADILYILGEYNQPTAEAGPADSLFEPPQVSFTGFLRPPASYAGIFFSGFLYNANVLFRGWQACS